jgi:cellobiose epimerase
MIDRRFIKLREEVSDELVGNILPFWMEKMTDNEHGGFYGQITGMDKLVPEAPKGGILNARILWTFSSVAIHLNDEKYLKYAQRAKDYILKYFLDEKNGGIYWMVNANGSPADTKKQIYCQAFCIYAFTEYYKATFDRSVLDKAIGLFRLIEKHSFDNGMNGYLEAYSEDWKLLEDLRLSTKDANEKKTMNTHLHILEAYTNLYRVYKDDELRLKLKNLIELFLEKIINHKTHHLDLFFDENWNCKSTIVSYGHDIEASWLLEEAAGVYGDGVLLKKVREESVKIAEAACEGIQKNGAIINEMNYATGHVDSNCDWWPQAEAIVGFYNAWELTKNDEFASVVLANWDFTKNNIVDNKNGEWHWSVSSAGENNREGDKAGFWKCPYHNSRMCLEMLERIK